MKNAFLILLSTILVSVSIFAFILPSFNNVKSQTGTKSLFETYCVSCHNSNKSSFINRKWMFGAGREDVFKSIKHGRMSYGMPSFSAGLSDNEIYELADYVLSLSQKEEEDKVKLSDLKSDVINSDDQVFRVEEIIGGLDIPWGMAFLPNGDMLINERDGRMLLWQSSGKIEEVKNVPAVVARGQGGLLDIELHPNYAANGWIYFSYSCPSDEDAKHSNTAVMRARLDGNRLVDNEKIFQALPYTNKRHHFGSKIEFDKEGFLYFSVGDRGERDRHPQELDNHCGKIHRIHDDGRIPHDNPFIGQVNAKSSIFSYGHRNPQGVCMHPVTGEIWTDEHGPKGGDEINIIEKGKNYGWPVISFGINYNGTSFTNDTAMVGMEQPLLYWVPSIAPCGMTFVKGNRYPKWENDILTGSLRFEYLHRVVLDGNTVVREEKLLEGIGRVRNVEMSPDGYIFVALEKPGRILKLVPLP